MSIVGYSYGFFLLFFAIVENLGIFKSPYHYEKNHVWRCVVHICFKLFSLVGHTHEWKTISQVWWIVVLTIRSFRGLKKIQRKWILIIVFTSSKVSHFNLHSPMGKTQQVGCEHVQSMTFIASSKNIHTTWLNVMHNKQPHM